jgi:Domain of unknown function (DUF1877)
MGVCFVAYSVSRGNLALILADPPLVWRVLDSDSDASYLKQLAAENRPTLLQRLFGSPKPTPEPKSLSFLDGELRELDVDKAWDGLRLCIKQCAPNAPDFFEGDGQIGSFEVGYGPALYAKSETIAEFASALEGIDEVALLDKLRSEDFKDVYLSGVWQRRDDEAKSYLLENFRELLAFTKHCAGHQHAAVLQFT